MKISGVCLPDDPEGNAKLMLSILDCLPRANRVGSIFVVLNYYTLITLNCIQYHIRI